ncbi:hypothetical protein M3X99_13080 [Clostridium perfringens]|uniref:hypothetical protein n=1 Tax=Clostridium perfringens TaxID=1502 RepID=UPI0023409E13|nr:hypothetical protein [Clostridium perfringens]MDC4251942.1 hypothetical protein [Clostridium perfringens]
MIEDKECSNGGQVDDIVNDSIIIDNVVTLEYFDVIKNEYEIERNKKQSFESRASLIITILGAICVFVFDKINFSQLYEISQKPLYLLGLVKIIIGITVYLSFITTVILLVKAINVDKYENFEVNNIDEKLMLENKVEGIMRLVLTYKKIILNHRSINEKKAKNLRYSFLGIIITILSIVIYINL